MKLMDVLTKLKELNLPVIHTNDIAAYLNVSANHANKLLSRIAETKQLIHIKRGVWIYPDTDPLILPSFLTAPFPSYVSLQTALYYHGMISQIPTVIYAISLGRTKHYKTAGATISVHHVDPSFFFGFDEIKVDGLLKIATPEKALLDVLYLSQTKTRLFKTLPELELPKQFNLSLANKMIGRIGSIRRKSLVQARFSELINRNKFK